MLAMAAVRGMLRKFQHHLNVAFYLQSNYNVNLAVGDAQPVDVVGQLAVGHRDRHDPYAGGDAQARLTYQRRSATPAQIASTSPNGQAPCRNP